MTVEWQNRTVTLKAELHHEWHIPLTLEEAIRLAPTPDAEFLKRIAEVLK